MTTTTATETTSAPVRYGYLLISPRGFKNESGIFKFPLIERALAEDTEAAWNNDCTHVNACAEFLPATDPRVRAARRNEKNGYDQIELLEYRF